MPRFLLAAAFVLATLISLPVHAETPPAAAAAPDAVTQGSEPASEARIAKMRDRWKKMTPEQREEMRKKATRRLQERYERLSPQEQAQINGISDQIGKLSREQRSILLARVHQKAYEERQQKRAMKEQESKGAAGAPPASAPSPAAAPASVTAPPAPAVAPASKPVSP